MTESLKVIALISGGKDSLYSLLHCIQQGHQVIALANLHPSTNHNSSTNNNNGEEILLHEDSDLDSFMYQTVGHSLIPLYAQCLRLPLYRRAITGSALQVSRDYSYTQHSASTSPPDEEVDEVEDLIPLLRTVLQNHPEANAISTGAIQSTYQRTRVESIAVRLGLIPLGYLWQYIILPPVLPPLLAEEEEDQNENPDSLTSLLDDMSRSGSSSRIIKIASGGIPESLLWSDVTTTRTKNQLINGLSRFFDKEEDEMGLRGALVGEGGEYETLAMCGPRNVWKGGRIVVDDEKVKTYTGEGGASYVRIEAARVVPWDDVVVVDVDKGDDNKGIDTSGKSLVRIPAMFDEQFRLVKKTVLTSMVRSNPLEEILDHSTTQDIPPPQFSYSISSNTIYITNISHLSSSNNDDRTQTISLSPTEQMTQIATLIKPLIYSISTTHNIQPPLTPSSSIIFTTLLLRNMSDFVAINPIYASIFEVGVPNPPARVTVAAPLPEGLDVMISLVLDLGPRDERRRRGLHVQSRSYWAPANIGPYSQAIAVPLRKASDGSADDDDDDDDEDERGSGNPIEIVYVAGQIPLVPSSMQMLESGFVDQAVLSLQHLWRVGQERGVDQWTTGVAFIPRLDSGEMTAGEKAAKLAEVWRAAHLVVFSDRTSDSTIDDDDDEEEEDPDFDVWHQRNNHPFSSTYQPPTRSATQRKGGRQQYLHQLPNLSVPITSMSHGENGVTATDNSGRREKQRKLIVPSLIIAEVTALPRNASVEWWSTGLASLLSSPSTDSHRTTIEHVRDVKYTKLKITSLSSSSPSSHMTDKKTYKRTNFVAYFFLSSQPQRALDEEEIGSILSELTFDNDDVDGKIVTGTCFVASSDLDKWKDLSSIPVSIPDEKEDKKEEVTKGSLVDLISFIPCYRVWGQIGECISPTSSSRPSEEKVEERTKEYDLALILRLE